MKKLLATTAIALISMAGAASAQSVLERVLGQIDNATNLAQVNGTFANIAENIGGSQTIYVNAAGDSLSEVEYAALQAAPTEESYVAVPAGAAINNATGTVISSTAYLNLSAGDKAKYTVAEPGQSFVGADGVAISSGARSALPNAEEKAIALAAYNAVVTAGGFGVDGSITNIVDGITEATQTAVAGSVNAVEYDMPTLDFGDMATTALGAVNTGDITLGVNSSVDEAKTTSTQAVSTAMTQLGGSADTGALVLNIASNMTGVNGSISNTMTEVNGAVGNLSTTALGAVNTGTITSGVNAAVQGIVGTSGQ